MRLEPRCNLRPPSSNLAFNSIRIINLPHFVLFLDVFRLRCIRRDPFSDLVLGFVFKFPRTVDYQLTHDITLQLYCVSLSAYSHPNRKQLHGEETWEVLINRN